MQSAIMNKNNRMERAKPIKANIWSLKMALANSCTAYKTVS